MARNYGIFDETNIVKTTWVDADGFYKTSEGGAVPTSWKSIQDIVKAGNASSRFAVGDELISKYIYNGTAYDCRWVVLDVNRECEWEDGTTHPGLWLGMKYATPEKVQFDNAEQILVNLDKEPNALEGWYYWGVTGTTYTKLEVSTGDVLPTTYDAIYRSTINDVYAVHAGYNRWSHSAMRQWLNSAAGINKWWVPQHEGDIAPTQLSTIRGFMANLDKDFLSVINPVKVQTACNTVTDDGVTDITYDRFFLQSLEEVYGVPQDTDAEGPYFPYWKQVTGLDEPSNGSAQTPNEARKIRQLNNPNGNAANVRLRSASRGNSGNVWFMYAGGYLPTNVANSSCAALPACVIS